MVNKNLIGGASSVVRTAMVCLIVALCQAGSTSSKTPSTLSRIRQAAMASHYGYQQLQFLCNGIGPRMAGSPQAAAGVEFVAQEFRTKGLKVSLEATPVPHWIRGEETAELVRYPAAVAGTT